LAKANAGISRPQWRNSEIRRTVREIDEVLIRVGQDANAVAIRQELISQLGALASQERCCKLGKA
jgi:hypothetical protein